MTDETKGAQVPTPGPLTAAIDMLSEARDFIDRFSDVNDGDYGASEPNAAMVMVHEINATIDHLSAPTAPVEASGSEREADAWKWLGQLYPNDAPSDLAYDANEMVDAFLAGSGRSDRMAKALERIADEQQYRSGYCQTDITVEPALTAEEAQTVAREALAQQTAPRPQPSGETREGVSESELRDAITLILPLAKGYAAANPVGSNQSYVDYVESLFAGDRPAPVASGGQHSSGEGECVIVLRSGLEGIEQLLRSGGWTEGTNALTALIKDAGLCVDHLGFLIETDDGTEWVEDDPRETGIPEYFENLRPLTLAEAKSQMLSAWEDARSEPPVAETAGEAVAWRRRPLKESTGSGKEWVLYGPEDAAHYNAATDRYVIQALGIIDPVPDDKLRIAVEALEFYAGPHALPNEGPWGASSDDYGRRAAETLRVLQSNATGWTDVKCQQCGVAFGLHLPSCLRPAVSDEDQ